MPSFTPSSSVQMTSSGFITSMSWPVWIWPAVTSPGPVAVSVMRFGPSPCMRSASCFTFSTMSVTSSRTPGTVLNSCSTPSIWIAVTAAPCSDDSRMRRSALPSVMPKPRSSGSATMVATREIGPGLGVDLLRLDQRLPVALQCGTEAHGAQTLRRLRGRQPLCGIGVMSRIAVMENPTVCNARSALSRPDPGPLTSISSVSMPCSRAFLPASSAAT